MRRVSVDPQARTVHAQGGALLGDLDRETTRYGLAVSGGIISHTGIGGLTLGGGFGWISRKHGYSVDNLLSAQVVTADGYIVRASAAERADLFWGLRGGGGNFGIVTEFEFQLHPVGTRTLVAEFDFPIDKTAAAMRAWRDLSESAPRAATFNAAVGPDDVAMLGFIWVGDPEEGRRLLPSMGALGTPIAERVGEMSYVELQTKDDSVEGYTYRRYWKGHLLPELSDAAIDALVGRAGQTDLLPGLSLQAYGGAISDVPEDDTVFSNRGSKFEYIAAARWDDPAEDTDRLAVARRCAAEVEPFASGVYVNVLSDDGAGGLQRAFSGKFDRLTALKDAYDPDNTFHLNPNIRPSG